MGMMNNPPAIGLMSGDQVERFAAGSDTQWDGVPGTWRLLKVSRGHIPRQRLYSFGPTLTSRGDRYVVGLYDIGKHDGRGMQAEDLPQIPPEGVEQVAICQVVPA
jgi:hypothetical protein